MKQPRVWVIGSVAAWLISFVVASSQAAPAGQVDVTYMYNPFEQAYTEAAVNFFMEKNPGITVEALPVPDFAEDKQKTMIVAGAAPDLLMLFTTEVPLYVNQGWVVPIDHAVTSDDLAHYYPAMVDGARYEGRLYGLPIDEPSAMSTYFIRSHFEEAGLAFPDENWTWEDYLDYSRKLTIRTGDQVEQYGTSVDEYWGWYLPWIWQNGGRTLNDDKTETLWTMPETLEAFSFMNSLFNEWGVAAHPTVAWDLFFGNQISVSIGGVWLLSEFGALQEEGVPLDWDVTALPRKEREATYSSIRMLGVNQSAPNKEAAIKLLKFLAGPETQMIRAQNGRLPTVIDSDVIATALEGLPPGAIHIFESFDVTEWEWLSEYWPLIRDQYGTEVLAMYDGKQSPVQTVERLKSIGDAALSR